MKVKYGELNEKQLQAFRKKLHNKIHWLLIYEDPKSNGKFDYVNIPSYVDSLLRELDAFNSLLLYPSEEIVEIDCVLKEAERLVGEQPFDFKQYRRCVLGAHSLLDKISFKDAEDDNA